MDAKSRTQRPVGNRILGLKISSTDSLIAEEEDKVAGQ